MYIPRPDEKKTPVMLYTKDSVLRGELVTKEIVHRVNIWLRTDGVPKYMHLLDAQLVMFGAGQGKTLSYPEIYYPSAEVIGFHTLPPTDEPLDYDPAESNRMMVPVDVMAGSSVMKGRIRISTQTEVGVSLEVARALWMSLYDALITNPYLPQMPSLSVPLVLVNPAHVAFGIAEQAGSDGT